MERLSNSQEDRRKLAETAIGVAAPFLDIMLAAGERLSRITEPVDYEYYPVRVPGGEELDRSSRVVAAAETDDDR